MTRCGCWNAGSRLWAWCLARVRSTTALHGDMRLTDSAHWNHSKFKLICLEKPCRCTLILLHWRNGKLWSCQTLSRPKQGRQQVPFSIFLSFSPFFSCILLGQFDGFRCVSTADRPMAATWWGRRPAPVVVVQVVQVVAVVAVQVPQEEADESLSDASAWLSWLREDELQLNRTERTNEWHDMTWHEWMNAVGQIHVSTQAA